MAIKEMAEVEVQVNSQQAKENLKSLEAHAASLRKQMDEAFAAGDTKHLKELEKEFRSVQNEIRTTKKDTTALTEVMQNLDKATPKELRATLKAINRELNSGHVKRGSAEWKYYQEQAKRVTRELRNIQNETRETTSWLNRFNNGLSKWGGLAASAAAAITGVAMTLSTLRNNRNAKEDAQHELKALTGLGDDSITWLTEQAEILSTTMEESGLRIRQSSDEILKAYMLVGSKKPELLGNKEALNAVTIEAMRLAAAAKIDLTEAVEATTISLNMFGEKADQAAKYVNILAAGSQAGSASVAAQTAAIKNAGVAAATAGVTMEQLNGVIQTLAKKGIEAEPAGTALRKFFLVLQTGADETNPKIVGLDKALENLAAQNLTAAEMQKKFGDEAFSAASIIINGTEDYQHFTEAVTDTSVAIEQAAINSDTASAKMEQHKNKIKEAGIELMERLNPSLSLLTGWTSKIISALPALIDWFIKYKGIILASAAAVSAYAIAVNLANIKTKLLSASTRVASAAVSAFNLVLKLNPMTALLSVGIGVATFFGGKWVSKILAAKEAQREFNKELHKTKEEMDSLNSVKADAQNSSSMDYAQRDALRDRARKEIEVLKKTLNEKEKEYKDHYDKRINYIMQYSATMSEKYRQTQYAKEKQVLQNRNKTLDPIRKEIAAMEAIIKKLNAEDLKTVTKSKVTVGSPVDDNKENAAAIAEQKRYEDELLSLKESYLKSESMSRADYRKMSEDAEMRHLQNMLDIAGLEPKKRQQIMNQLLDLKIRLKEKIQQVDDVTEDDNTESAFSLRKRQYELDVEGATKRHYDSLSSEEDYYNELKRIRDEYYNDVLNSTETSEEEKAEIQDAKEKEALDKSKENYDKHKEKLKSTLAVYQEIGKGFGEAFAQLITDSEFSIKEFLKTTITLALDALQRVMILAVAETQIKNITKLGPFGLLKAAGEIALITAAFETAKALVSGFEDGGYTGDGAHDEPKGVVHAGEFVANRHAVNNTAVRPVLDMIDNAQRNNTIGSLTASDIAAAVSGNSYSTVNNYTTNNADSSAVIAELIVVINKLKRRLDVPVLAYTKATGDMSVNEAQKLIDKMNHNASNNI